MCFLFPVDEIYHLACPASPPNYMYNPIKTIKTNTLGTINMLGQCLWVWERERECVCVWMHVYLCVWEFVCHWFYLTASVFIQNPPVILTDTHTYIHHTYGDGKGVKIHFSFMACHDDRSVWDIFIKCVWTFNMDRTNTLVRELISAQKDRTSTTKTGVTYGNSHLACVWVQGTWTPPEVKGI